MAQFEFNLEGVLRARKSVEKQRQSELAQALSQLQELQDQLEALDRQVKGTTEDLRQNHLSGILDLRFLAAHRRYVNAMQRKAMDIAQGIRGRQRQVDAARLALAEAAKGRRVMEKLREKQFQRWRRERARKEMLQQDELNVQMSYQKILAQEAADMPIIPSTSTV